MDFLIRDLAEGNFGMTPEEFRSAISQAPDIYGEPSKVEIEDMIKTALEVRQSLGVPMPKSSLPAQGRLDKIGIYPSGLFKKKRGVV